MVYYIGMPGWGIQEGIFGSQRTERLDAYRNKVKEYSWGSWKSPRKTDHLQIFLGMVLCMNTAVSENKTQ
jgi:hypothetical protein